MVKINDRKIASLKAPIREKSTIMILQHEFPVVQEFKYLGTLFTADNVMITEIEARIAAENRCYFTVLVYKFNTQPLIAIVFVVATFGSSSQNRMTVFNVWEKKIFRKIYDPQKVIGKTDIMNNSEIREKYSQPYIVSYCF